MAGISQEQWMQARELLAALSQTLTPLIESSSEKAPLPIALQFFTLPKEREKKPFSHDARLLMKLQTVQTKVSRWLEKIEEPSKREGSAPTSNQEKRGISLSKEREAPPSFASAKNSSSQSPNTFSTPSRTPIAQSAQSVAKEVREAIRLLATSAYIGEPKIDPVREAIKKIKPMIDQLVEAVETGHQSGWTRDRIPSKEMPQIRKSFREELLFKESVQNRLYSERTLDQERSSIIQEKQEQEIPPKKGEAPPIANPITKSQPPFKMPQLEERAPLQPKQSKEEPIQAPLFRFVLPGAPFQPTPPFSLQRRKGKEKKRFPWHKEAKDDSRDPRE